MTFEEIKKNNLRKFAEIAVFQEGRAKGREEGRVEGMQQALFNSLRKRFNDLSQKICDTIHGIHDFDILQRLLDVSYKAKTATSFEKKAQMILIGAI
ncbi:MAG: hypothetical protein LBR22_09370 [Desulfovibrio sp.]|jgi:flagellar biosynthesis/type III secretory pathway protein FliH|nr:hypothetical protein [Desulfovibrio sp.]